MAVLADQRQMTGPDEHADQAGVRAFWEAFPQTPLRPDDPASPPRGFPARVARGDYTTDLRRDDRQLVAYVNDGRWVADCPNCNGGVAAGPEFSEGCCLSCGTIYGLRHPDERTVAEVEAALSPRAPQNRNFHPWRETPEDLDQENRAHAVGAKELSEFDRVAGRLGLSAKTVERVLREAGRL